MSETLSIFVSYRRDDASHLAGRLADRLAEQFRIFMDVEAIEAGTDFAEVVHRAVSECDVLLAVIGPRWLNAADEGGQRRLDQADDWVSEEIGVALDRGIRVIPVLVDGARMPEAQQLPTRLARLAHRQAFTVHHESFTADMARLISVIGRSATTPSGTPAPALTSPSAAGQRQTAAAAAVPSSSGNRRPIWLPAGVILLLGVIVAGAIVWDGQRDRSTSAAPSTSPVVVTSPAASSPPPSASVVIPVETPTSDPSPRVSVRPKPTPPKVTGGEVDFRYFRVTVTRLRRSEGLTAIAAKVCVRRLPPDPQGDRTRISWGPWTVVTKNGRVSARSSAKSADLQGLFPPDATYRVGTCAAGWIPFPDVSRLADVKNIRYKNGVGDAAEWRVG